MTEQARYMGRRTVNPQKKPPEQIPNRPAEPLNLAKPELMPKDTEEAPPQG